VCGRRAAATSTPSNRRLRRRTGGRSKGRRAPGATPPKLYAFLSQSLTARPMNERCGPNITEAVGQPATISARSCRDVPAPDEDSQGTEVGSLRPDARHGQALTGAPATSHLRLDPTTCSRPSCEVTKRVP
jgi:hypothetical protein